MHILQLCKKFPYPLHSGEAVAVTYMARALHEHGVMLDLLSMNTLRHTVDTSNAQAHLPHYRVIRTVSVDNRVKPIPALYNLLWRRSYHIQRFVSRAYAQALTDMLQSTHYDVVQLESLYLAPYIPLIREHSSAIVAMRAHNLEGEIWERITANAHGIKQWYLRQLTRQLYRYEQQVMQQYDLLLTMSERDLEQYHQLGYAGEACVVPIGLDIAGYRPTDKAYHGKPTLAFIGTLDWQPNIEGLAWFLSAVWPAVLTRMHHAELYIAGKGELPDFLRVPLAGVTVVGEVDSAVEFIDQHAIHVVPLLSGSGMRVKILEAMAMARVVVSTKIGMEGICVESGREAFVTDGAEHMTNTILECVSRSQLSLIGKNARARIIQNYSYIKSAEIVLNRYLLQLKRK